MISPKRLAEIRALTWEWNYEDCSDHQAAVDDLLAERDQLQAELTRLRAEGRLLREALENECLSCQADSTGSLICLEHEPNCYVRIAIEESAPLIAAEAERVRKMEKALKYIAANCDRTEEEWVKETALAALVGE